MDTRYSCDLCRRLLLSLTPICLPGCYQQQGSLCAQLYGSNRDTLVQLHAMLKCADQCKAAPQ